MLGPIFVREWLTLPRRAGHYFTRSLYLGGLWVLLLTIWQTTVGWDFTATLGDFARFGVLSFQVLVYVQLTLLLFFAALSAASTISLEKDRRTFLLLLITDLHNYEIVLGKLFGSLLQIALFLVGTLPVFALLMLLGGIASVSNRRGRCSCSARTALAAGSLGGLVALWRDKTFQALAMTVLFLVLVSVPGAGPVVAPLLRTRVGQHSRLAERARSVSRARRSSRPAGGRAKSEVRSALGHRKPGRGHSLQHCHADPVGPAQRHRHHACCACGTRAANRSCSAKVVGAEPSRARPQSTPPRARPARLGQPDPVARDRHARLRPAAAAGEDRLFRRARPRLLLRPLRDGAARARPPRTAWCPIGILSLLLISAQAVTSITSERDLGSLDLLVITDLSPKEFIFGKVFGILYNTKEYIVPPLILIVVYAWRGQLGTPPRGHPEQLVGKNLEGAALPSPSP